MKRDITYIPNWLKDNNWTDAERLDWINQLFAFSSRDWSVYPKIGEVQGGYPDYEMWALYCLGTCKTKDEALKVWRMIYQHD